MKRAFLINILFLLLVNFLIKPIYIFGIDRTVQNRVGEDYGLYFTLLNFTILFQVIHDLGLSYFNSRHISQNRQLIDKYFPSLLLLKLSLSLAYLVILLIAGLIFGYTFQYFFLVFLLGCTRLFAGLVTFFRSNIAGLGLYMTDSMISIIDRLLLIIVCSYLLFLAPYKNQFEISWFVYAQVSTMSLAALIAFLIVRKRIRKFKWKWRAQFNWLILKKSFPYAFAVLLMILYTSVDSIMIEQLLSDGFAEVDDYASAFRLLNAVIVVSYMFSGLLLPMFSRMLKVQESVRQLLQFSFEMLMAGSITLAIGCIFYRNDIMILLYENGSAYTGSILALLMTSFIAICGLTPYSALMTANDSLKPMNRIFGFTVFLNIALNLILIPQFKALGAAIATCITQYTVFIGMVVLTNRILKIPFSPQVGMRIIGFSTLSMAIALLIQNGILLNWPIKFFLTLLSGLIWAMVFRLLDLKHLVELVKSRDA